MINTNTYIYNNETVLDWNMNYNGIIGIHNNSLIPTSPLNEMMFTYNFY